MPGSMWYGRATTSRHGLFSRAHHSSTSRDFLRSFSLKAVQGLVAGVDRPGHLLAREVGQRVLQPLEELLGDQQGLVERDERA